MILHAPVPDPTPEIAQPVWPAVSRLGLLGTFLLFVSLGELSTRDFRDTDAGG